MKYVDEYRDREEVHRLAETIRKSVTRPWTIMEVCGGQTHAIVRFGIDALLPRELELIHGPGCPVCVTPVELIDAAVDIASRPGVIFCSFGDMLRVPGTRSDLFDVRATGGDVRVVYSPLDAVEVATQEPGREVVFFAVGFETTAPATALAACEARRKGLKNFSLVVSHVLVPPAMEMVLASPESRVQAFLAAGHVSSVVGCEVYESMSERFGVPIVVTGFEPIDILQGVAMCVRQLEGGRARVENQYSRAVSANGNLRATALVEEVYRVVDREWRGVGLIERSGLGLSEEYSELDALERFGSLGGSKEEESECIAGLVLQGVKKPGDCPAFALRCTPEQPLGAPMVSSEGACAAYHRYKKPLLS